MDAEAETGTEDKAETEISSAVTRRYFFSKHKFVICLRPRRGTRIKATNAV